MTGAAQSGTGSSLAHPRADPAGAGRTPGFRRSRRRSDLAAVAALLALVLLVAWDRLLRRGLDGTDLATFFLPWYGYLGEHARRFDVPGWNPHQFGGTPFAGDPESGWGYLPAMLFFAAFPPVLAYKLFLLFHYALSALATYALARVLGLGATAAVVAGTAFVFGPFAHWSTSGLVRLQLLPWIPLALLGIEFARRGQGGSGRCLGWVVGGLAISQMLAGWVGQGAYYGLLSVAGYIAYRGLVDGSTRAKRGRDAVRLAADGIVVMSLGFGLGAAGLLPRLEVNRVANIRGGDYSAVADPGGGWEPGHLLAQVVGYGRSSQLWYAGGATLALALAALVLSRGRHAVPYFAALTAAAFVLTLPDTPIHRLFYVLPRFRVLHEHVPSRILSVTVLGLAMLAGAAVEGATRAHRWPAATAAAALPLVALVVSWRELAAHGRRVAGPTAEAVVLSSVLLAAGLVLARRAARSPRSWPAYVAPVLLLLVVAWDPTGREIVHPLPVARRGPAAVAVNVVASDPGGAGEFLQARLAAEGPFRYFGYDPGLLTTYANGDTRPYRESYRTPKTRALLVNARAMPLGLQDVQGYDPLKLERYVEFLDAINGGVAQDYHDANVLETGVSSPLLDLLNVRYVVIPNRVPADGSRPDLSYLISTTTEVFRNRRVRVLERPSALPRAWIVHEAVAVEPGGALGLLTTGVNPRRVAVLEREPPPLAEPEDPSADAVTVTHFEGDDVRLRARTAADGVLVLSEVYAPGWAAYVDGKRVPIYATDHVLRGIPLPAGEHAVEVRYESAWLRTGLAVTAGSLAACAVLLAVAMRRRWGLDLAAAVHRSRWRSGARRSHSDGRGDARRPEGA
jgi:Bacterial membrane protein YfhO